jgi:hypothetical protein
MLRMTITFLATHLPDVLGFLMLMAVVYLLKDKPRAIRLKVAAALLTISLLCWTALYFFG